ncbi:MAG: response regulator transcription factor [Bacteroidota bacterium]
MKSFLLIDDHPVIRLTLKRIIKRLFRSCTIHEAYDCESSIEKFKNNMYNLIIMDIQIPGNDMLQHMKYMFTNYPNIKVLIFSMYSESTYAKRFFKRGASGFLTKDASIAELTKAIGIIINGKKYMSCSFLESIIEYSISGKPSNPLDNLSSREFEIATMLLSGKTSKQISQLLRLKASTIGTHKARIFDKAGANNIIELKELATGFL